MVHRLFMTTLIPSHAMPSEFGSLGPPWLLGLATLVSLAVFLWAVWPKWRVLQRGTLTLATLDSSGRQLTVDEVFTVALHEIGHLIGLGHSDEARDVMYPTTSVHDLTTRDRRTAMLLYSLTIGSLKAPAGR